MKITVKQITMTAAFLAICIASQFFKNASVYITGPIINACLILTTLCCGLACGLILSVITPVTAFFITGSPIMSAIPAMFPAIMLGNAVLVVCVALLSGKMKKAGLPVSIVIGAIVKGAVMGLVISLLILPNLLPAKMAPKLTALQIQFSLTQFITAMIGGVIAFIISRIPLFKKEIDNRNNRKKGENNG